MFRFIPRGLILSMSLLAACQPSEDRSAVKTEEASAPPPSSNGVEPSTARMASFIAQSFASINPQKTPYHTNAARIEYFQQLVQNPNPQVKYNAWTYYADELLNGGYTEQAIVEFQSLIEALKKIPNSEQGILQARRLLAIAYLRLGEQTNCLDRRHPSSCIVPLAPEGQYQMTQSSEAAMQICLDILTYRYDEETVWILNLAAMTIGKYPDGVPEDWRIPEAFLHSRKTFPRFRDISQSVGIRGQNLAGGVCVADFDNDGWLDILTSSWGENDPLTFWKNDGKGGFINASKELGLDGITGGLNMIHADINNDGLADVFVLRGAWLFGEGKIPNSLLLNLGNGRFADITEQAGVLTFAPTQTAIFADFNLDGWVDLFVGNESTTQGTYQNELYINRGNNRFVNVISAVSVSSVAFLKGCAAGDFNNDGWPDLYLSVYTGPNKLLKNMGTDANGIPQFKDVAEQAGVQQPDISFPCWFWDFNNDGWEDIFVSAYGDGALAVSRDFVRNAIGKKLGGHPRVYQNNRDGSFSDVSGRMGLSENVFTMGCNYGDLDADGYLDFYLGTGNPAFSSIVPNKMYRNNAARTFEDVTGSGGFGHIQKGHAVAFGDFDRDGDEDIFQSLGGALAGDVYEDVLFENPIGQDKSWTVLKLQGVRSNRAAIGARVKVTVQTPGGKRSIYRTVSTGGSFGASSLQLEIGLDDATAIESVEITWPVQAQTKQVFRDIPINQYVYITEGNDAPQYPEMPSVAFRK